MILLIFVPGLSGKNRTFPWEDTPGLADVFGVKKLNSRILLFAAVILALEYAMLVFLKTFSPGPLFSGSETYGRLAEEIAGNGGVNFVSRPPLYPAILASLIGLSGSRWQILALLIQGAGFVFLGLLTMVLTCRLSGSRAIAMIAGALYAADVLFARESLAQRETIYFSTVLLLVIAMAVAARRYRSLLWYSGIGLLCAVGHLIRPNGFVLVFCIAVYLFFVLRDGPLKMLIHRMGAFAGTFLLFVLPWQVHLSQLAGSPTLASAESAGIGLWKGNHPEMEKFFPWVDMDILDSIAAEEVQRLHLRDDEIDDHFIALAEENVRKRPAIMPLRFLYKFVVFFLPVPTPFGSGELIQTASGLGILDFRPNLPAIVVGTPFLLVLFAGVVVSLSCVRRFSGDARYFVFLSLFIIAMFAVSFSITFTETRYRQPFEIEMIILASMGIGEILKALRRERKTGGSYLLYSSR